MVYFPHMKEIEFEERFDRLEKRLEEGVAQVTGLIDSFATLCAREFAVISEHFSQVEQSVSMTLTARLKPLLIAWTSRPRNVTSSPSAFPSLSALSDSPPQRRRFLFAFSS